MTHNQSLSSCSHGRGRIASQLGLALCAVAVCGIVDRVWAELSCASFASGGLVNTRLTAVAGTPFVGTTAGPQLVVEYGPLPCLLADSAPILVGDLDGNGQVDGADLALVLGSWGICSNPNECPTDLTNDGLVDGADLAIVLGNWGTGSP